MPTGLSDDALLRTALSQISPGTDLRNGLDRILRGRTGALIVLGSDDNLRPILSGGFHIDTDFSATKLRELAKMDGAIICDTSGHRILHAGVQLMPDISVETIESGTRHRTAERVAKQTGFPVISVSKSMNTITLYVHTHRHVLEDAATLSAQANQALATLEQYRRRLDAETSSLSALEIEDAVTVRDVTQTVQRQEMVYRISQEISEYVLELGTSGRLLALQLEELTGGLAKSRTMLLRDYLPKTDNSTPIETALAALGRLSSNDLLDLSVIAETLNWGQGSEALDTALRTPGFRVLSAIPQLPWETISQLVESFGDLQQLLAASVPELVKHSGITEYRGKQVREGLLRLAEASIAEIYG